MTKETASKRLIVGISGASGAVLGVEFLRALRRHAEWETHLIVSQHAAKTIAYETPYSLDEIAALATHTHRFDDIGASIASGSFKTEGMVIVPCSMKTLAASACMFWRWIGLSGDSRATSASLRRSLSVTSAARDRRFSEKP